MSRWHFEQHTADDHHGGLTLIQDNTTPEQQNPESWEQQTARTAELALVALRDGAILAAVILAVLVAGASLGVL